MNRPSLEMADLVRSAGRKFIERNRSWLNRLHLKVLTAIERCRTAALGGHLDECVRCGHRAISFNSCRNRHCPKCQANARDPQHLGADIGFFSVLHSWNQKLQLHPHS